MSIIICGTGHRPSKLGGYGEAVFENLKVHATRYFKLVGPVKVISGMALGWDQAIAVAALELGIPVSAYVPFAGQEDAWPAESQRRYRCILGGCAEVVIVSPGGYSPAAMQIRNRCMVDDADVVLALWDGSSGGTANCVNYALKKNKFIQNLWPEYSGTGFDPLNTYDANK